LTIEGLLALCPVQAKPCRPDLENSFVFRFLKILPQGRELLPCLAKVGVIGPVPGIRGRPAPVDAVTFTGKVSFIAMVPTWAIASS